MRPLLHSFLIAFSLIACASPADHGAVPADPLFRVERVGPILTPASHPEAGHNIMGPSVVRVPDWVEAPLGRYYLYFADHKGDRIRLAYADTVAGPWALHAPGALQLADSHFAIEPPEVNWLALQGARFLAWTRGIEVTHSMERELTMPHIASPDVHVDETNQRFVMYFHGLDDFASQSTRAATSKDGLDFEAAPEVLGRTYLRAFEHEDTTYALAMPGQIYRAARKTSGFVPGPLLFEPNMRHAGLLKRGDTLHVFWTRVGDAPEVILRSTVDLAVPWLDWRAQGEFEVLRPEHDWEGANAPVLPSIRSVADGHVNQLRDPFVFEDEGRTWLFYVIAGESGIALAELHLDERVDAPPATDAP